MHFEDIIEDVSTSLSDSDTKEALNEDKGMEEKHGVDHEKNKCRQQGRESLTRTDYGPCHSC